MAQWKLLLKYFQSQLPVTVARYTDQIYVEEEIVFMQKGLLRYDRNLFSLTVEATLCNNDI